MSESLLDEWPHAVAGCIAGLATVVALHPLDVIKTRMQVQDGKGSVLPLYRGTLHCFSTIWRREGLHGLYAGLAPCLIASTVSWGLYFFLYNRSKSSWRNKTDSSQQQLSSLQHLYSGIEAGAIATVLTNPIWVLKTRFQLQEQQTFTQLVQPSKRAAMKSIKRSPSYVSLCHAVKTIAREEGIRGFYRGLGPSLFMCINAAVQFTVYEELKRLAMQFTDGDHLPPMAAFVIGGASKITASIITYPTQVMRSRLQQRFDVGRSLKYTSMAQTLSTTIRREGVRGLYKGLIPNIMRVVPQSALMFMVYEKTISLLKSLTGGGIPML